MIHAVVVRGYLLELLVVLRPEDEAIPGSKVLPDRLRHVAIDHCQQCGTAVLTVNDPVLAVVRNIRQALRFELSHGHDTKSLLL